MASKKELSPESEAYNEIIYHAIDNIDRLYPDRTTGADLNNVLFNQYYFIIGYGKAEEFLNKVGTFDAIRKVQKYEQDNFGEVNTNLGDSEKVANMYAYIIGEELLNESQTLQYKWDDELSENDLKEIKKELESQYIGGKGSGGIINMLTKKVSLKELLNDGD